MLGEQQQQQHYCLPLLFGWLFATNLLLIPQHSNYQKCQYLELYQYTVKREKPIAF